MQKEERLKQEKTESAHLASTSKDKNKKRNKDKEIASGPTQKKHHKEEDQGCYFYKTSGHMKKNCTKYHSWHAKKGTLLALVCSKVNLAYVPRNTWWIDSGATTHTSVSMQGCLSYQAPNDAKRFIYVGNGKSMEVEAIGHFRLLLRIEIYLDLKETFIVPSFRRNLVYISILDKFSYTCSFGNSQFSLYLNSNIVSTGSLLGFDNLYLLDIIASYYETLHVSSHGTKRKLTNENSTTLWHKQLGHIFKNRIERLVSNGILDSLDLTNFTICVECIKGKQTKNKRLGANRAS